LHGKQTKPHYVGASVRGPSNAARNKLKQDAWNVFNRSWGTLGVVCDGLGSKSKSRTGALAACLAVRDMLNQVDGLDMHSNLGTHLKTIEQKWLARIHPHNPNDCMTTCLFCVYTEDNWFGAQLGDGFLGALLNDGNMVACSPDGELAFNLTNGLGDSSQAKTWRTLGPLPAKDVHSIILATDGVSDDIPLGSYPMLLEELVNEYQPLNQMKRYQLLRRELVDWPTPHHLDDKTLLALWSNKSK